MSKILLIYPIHPALVIQLATLFPNYEFVMFQISSVRYTWEMYIKSSKFPSNAKLTTTCCSLFPNPNILAKHLETNKYDYAIFTARTKECWNTLKNAKIPTVWVALSSGTASFPPKDFNGQVVASNDETLRQIKSIYPKAKVIHTFKPRSVLPHWIGTDNTGYFMPTCLMSNRIVCENLKIWEACQPYLNCPKEYLDEEKYNILRATSRFYIEISPRDNSSVFLESQLMGCPAIVPNRPDFNKFVKHGVNGLLYNNLEEAVECCKRLSSDFRYTQQLSSQIPQIIDKLINEDDIKKKWKEILK